MFEMMDVNKTSDKKKKIFKNKAKDHGSNEDSSINKDSHRDKRKKRNMKSDASSIVEFDPIDDDEHKETDPNHWEKHSQKCVYFCKEEGIGLCNKCK